jgi:hypothetical protein
MNRELAEHISLLAAPIYAALLTRDWTETRSNIPPEMLSRLRGLAITQAHALWLDTLETPD